MFIDVTVIRYEDFRNQIDREQVGTLSKYDRPGDNEKVWYGKISLQDLLDLNTYPVFYFDPTFKVHRSYSSADATAIRYKDALTNSIFQAYFQEPAHIDSKNIDNKVILFQCVTCDRYIVIDGNHRITMLYNSGNLKEMIKVYCLSGSDWDQKTPDINIVCICENNQK